MPLLVETEAEAKAGHSFEPFNDMHPPLLCADAVPDISEKRVSAAVRRAKEHWSEAERLFLPCPFGRLVEALRPP